MSKEKHTPLTLPVTATCLYYPGGKLNCQGRAAIVTRADHRGMLDLSVFAPNARNIEVCQDVRHKDDPELIRRPERAKRDGVWDFGPCSPRSDVPEATESEAAILPTHTEDEVEVEFARLVDLLGDGESKKIADRMTNFTGEAWNYQKVNIRIRNMRKSSD